MQKIISLLLVLILVGAASTSPLPPRLLVELSDDASRLVREENQLPSFIDTKAAGMIKLTPVFPIPKDEVQREEWYRLGMNRWFRVESEEFEALELVNYFQIGEDVLSYEIIEPIQAQIQPNDYNIHDMWGLTQMRLPFAWDVHHGDSDVIIATLDAGCRIDHLDLEANIYINPGEDLNHNGIWDFADNNGIDDDANGYLNDIIGWDFMSHGNAVPVHDRAVGEDYGPPDNEVFPDVSGHGTHVAGTAAATTNNQIGVAAASWNVKSMPLRTAFAMIEDGELVAYGYWDDFAEGVQYAVDNGARVISISYSGETGSIVFANALQYARTNNVLVFAAAGNDDSNAPCYPAYYTTAIAVAATDENDIKAYFSNYGTWVDLCAPGIGIWSTVSNNQYHPQDYINWQGTSMATPNAAAVAALLLNYNPELTDDELETILLNTCDNIEAHNPQYIGLLGAGRVNAEAAIQEATPWFPIPPNNLNATLDDITGHVSLSWNHAEYDGFISFVVYRNDELIGSPNGTTYNDMLPAYGIYDYEVSALYDRGESEPTDPVRIIWEENLETHFNPVTPTGLPYAILVAEATMDNEDLCVGAVVVTGIYPLAFNAWREEVAYELPGFTLGNPMFFRIWNGEREMDAAATYLGGHGNGTFGYGPYSEVNLEAVSTITMTLPLRGNYFEMISFYLAPLDLQADIVFGNVPNLVIVYQDDGRLYLPPILNTIGNINVVRGYRIFCNQASQISAEGFLLDELTEYHLVAGPWNWFGYPFDVRVPSTVALAQIADIIRIVITDDGRMWVPQLVNTLGEMRPGEGYMTIVTQNITFHYERAGLAFQAVAQEQDVAPAEPENNLERTGMPYAVLVQLSEKLQNRQPAIIELLDQSAIVGKAEIEDAAAVIPVIAWQKSEQFDLPGFTEGHFIEAQVRRSGGESIPVIQSEKNRYGRGAYAFLTLDTPELLEEFKIGSCYPNPFNGAILAPLAIPKDGLISFTIIDILGRIVYDNTHYLSAGNHIFNINVSNEFQHLSSGVYFLQVCFEGETHQQKLVFLK